MIYRVTTTVPRFRRVSPGGHFKGRDPTVDRQALLANWVPGAGVVYIGKADKLRTRLRAYLRFGQGVPIGHWGGRLIWQLADSDKLLVAWKYVPGEVPVEVEQNLIAGFQAAYGKKPFANDPHLLGG